MALRHSRRSSGQTSTSLFNMCPFFPKCFSCDFQTHQHLLPYIRCFPTGPLNASWSRSGEASDGYSEGRCKVVTSLSLSLNHKIIKVGKDLQDHLIQPQMVPPEFRFYTVLGHLDACLSPQCFCCVPGTPHEEPLEELGLCKGFLRGYRTSNTSVSEHFG